MDFWNSVNADIAAHLASDFTIKTRQPVSGGSINSAFTISGSGRSFFVKCNREDRLGMFTAEAAGLYEIEQSRSIRVPQVVCTGIADNKSYIVLEHIDFSHAKQSPALFGQQLAGMHKCTATDYGWQQDNTIGSTLQINRREQDWLSFWREHRLGFQLQLACDKGYGPQLMHEGERLLACMPALFNHYEPVPSLLHGDLWSGNYAYDTHGRPVIFDPAVYYGDRETDIAMTELFGGFGAEFYQAYNEAFPLDEGYQTRKSLYNLYHILNHLNLFGTAYLGQSVSMMQKLLAEC